MSGKTSGWPEGSKLEWEEARRAARWWSCKVNFCGVPGVQFRSHFRFWGCYFDSVREKGRDSSTIWEFGTRASKKGEQREDYESDSVEIKPSQVTGRDSPW